MQTHSRRDNPPALESWAIFLAATAVGLVAGALAWRNGLADWDALAALSHAQDVCHREPRFNLALMGFVAPPVTTLLYLPFAGFFPALASSGLACPILGALLLGGCAVLLNGFGLYAGLGRSRWIVVVALVLNGPILSLAALGSPGIVLAFVFLGGAAALMRWAREQSFRDLVTCSLMMAAAALTRYDAIWLVLTATLFVMWRTYRTGEGWSRTEGTLIAFLLPIAYAYAVWVGANWAILGDPWYFLRESAGASSAGADTLTSLLLVVGVMAVACPPLFGLMDHEIRGVGGRRPLGRAGAWLIVGGFLGAAGSSLVNPVAIGEQSYRLQAVLVSCIVIGLALVLTVLGQFVGRRGEAARLSVWGPVLLAVAGFTFAGWAQWTDHGLPISGLRPVFGEPAFASSVTAEHGAAEEVRGALQPGQRLYIKGQDGYAVSLFLGAPERTTVFSDASELARTSRAGDLVAIQDPSDLVSVAAALSPRKLGLTSVNHGRQGWAVLRVSRHTRDEGSAKPVVRS